MIDQKPAVDLFLIVQSVIVILFSATCCYMFATQAAIPDLLQIVTAAIVSSYITARQGASQMRQSAQAVKAVAEALQ